MTEVAMVILKSVSKELASLLVKETKKLYRVHDKIEKLQLDLELMQGFLQDAAKKQRDSQVIRIWVSQIRDFAYNAQDVIEKYIVAIDRCDKPEESGLSNIIKWVSHANIFSSKQLHLYQISSELDVMSQRLSELTLRLQACQVQGISTDNMDIGLGRLIESRQTDSYIGNEDVIVGLDKDVDIILHQLVNTSKKVVAISGMGGLGKSTLAKKVCNHMTVKKEFKSIVWVFLSEQFEIGNILQAILRKLWFNDIKKREQLKDLGDEELPEKIREEFQQKKYLIVLDDLWTEESWDRLRHALSLPDRSPSKILLTTRNHELQKYIDDTGFLHKLKPLDPENSWTLLHKIASKGQYIIDSEMKTLGGKMLEHCQYLPLATITIGGILKLRSTRDSWRVVYDNIHSIITNNSENRVKILGVLKLSYDELPYFLKPCFLYLACFPEDYEIKTKKLYHLWAAEGFISLPSSSSPSVNMFGEVITLDDVSKIYLEELVKRCMMQVEGRNDSGKITSIRMHDIMREMCKLQSNEESLFCIITPFTSTLNYNSLHRVAVHDGGPTSTSLWEAMFKNARHLRSILSFSTRVSWEKGLRRSFVLRVLHIEDRILYELPKDIPNLVHLKYLSLKGTRIDELPYSIGNLRWLETLDLRTYKSRVKLPNVLWKMRMLKHLYLPRSYGVNGQLRLNTLRNLETLENFSFKVCQAKDLLEIKSLRGLTTTSADTISLEEMESLQIVHKLPFIALGRCDERTTIAILGMLLNDEFVDKIVQLPGYGHFIGRMLIRLEICSDLNSIKIAFLNLTELVFSWCEMKSDPMPVLETLPKLSRLIMEEKSFDGKKMICSSGWFSMLSFLMLHEMENLEEWVVEEGAMPNLKLVVIRECAKLKQLPNMLTNRVEIDIADKMEDGDKYDHNIWDPWLYE